MLSLLVRRLDPGDQLPRGRVAAHNTRCQPRPPHNDETFVTQLIICLATIPLGCGIFAAFCNLG